MSDVVIIGGPPGAGKTVIAGGLAAEYSPGVHLETDLFFHFITNGYIPPWRPESDTQNHVVNVAIARSAAAYAHGGYTVIVDGINGPWFLDHLLANLVPRPKRVHYLVVRCDPDVAVARIRERPDRTIDEAAVRFMHERFAEVDGSQYQVLDTTALSTAPALTECRALIDSGRLQLDW